MKKFLLMAVLSLVLGLGIYSVIQSLRYAGLAAQLQQSKAELAATQATNEQLSGRITRMNSELEQAIEDAEATAVINSSYERDVKRVQEQNTQLSHQAKDLRSSPYETTRHWADATLPDDARQLLQQATSANHSNTNGVSDPTGSPAG